MEKFCTFVTYDDEDPQVLSFAEWSALAEDQKDWAEWVWQMAPDAETAIANHAACMDRFEADVKAGGPTRTTYEAA